MKNNISIKTALSIFLFSALFLFIGCNEKADMVNSPQQDESINKDYYVLGVEDAVGAIEDGTLEKDMGFSPLFADGKFPPKDGDRKGKRGEKGKRWGKNQFKGKGLNLKLVFYKLDLSDEQKENIEIYFAEHHECVAVPFEQFREGAKEIMEAKRAEMQAIREKVRNQELTREEAHEKIKLLNDTAREEIKNCEECIDAKEDMCECRTTLLDNIASELDADQLIIWTKWLSEHPTPCDGD